MKKTLSFSYKNNCSGKNRRGGYGYQKGGVRLSKRGGTAIKNGGTRSGSQNIRVMTAVKKDLVDKVVVDHRTDLIDYLYFMLLDVREIDSRSKRSGRKTRVINVHDN